MATTLSYGFVKPQTPDAGSVFFPALENNIQQLNDHTHNGINSATLTSASVTATTQAILAAAWAATSGGTYKQTVTMPAGITMATHEIGIRMTTLGHVLFLTIEKVSANSFDIYINDNTLNLTAVYT